MDSNGEAGESLGGDAVVGEEAEEGEETGESGKGGDFAGESDCAVSLVEVVVVNGTLLVASRTSVKSNLFAKLLDWKINLI